MSLDASKSTRAQAFPATYWIGQKLMWRSHEGVTLSLFHLHGCTHQHRQEG